MAGYKTWAVGEEVLAADHNSYIQSQVVARFPNASTRTAQLPAPAVNQLSMLDTAPGVTEFWTGTAWANTTEVFYNQITAPVTVTAGAANVSQLVVAGAAVVYDGRPVIVEFTSPAILTPNIAGGSIMLNLIDGVIDLGYLGQVLATSPQIQVGITFRRRITPTAGTHTYQIAGWRAVGGTGTVQAGPGGVDQLPPAFMRIIRA